MYGYRLEKLYAHHFWEIKGSMMADQESEAALFDD